MRRRATEWRRAVCCAGLAAVWLSWPATAQEGARTPLDKVVAVVNDRAILTSDIGNELRLSVLEPRRAGDEAPNARGALQELISRALIEQQIRQEDEQAAEPALEDVEARLAELRKELPACVRMNCAIEAGWKAFLGSNGLTERQVEDYLRERLRMLRFIESRFRQGIRIPQEEIEAYYRDSLLPQYGTKEAAPKLADVTPRIEEILLQQQVNAMFGAWLENLRKQGDVEILDAELEPAGSEAQSGGANK